MILARLEARPAADRRRSARHRLHLGSSLPEQGEQVTVHEISATGMLLETAARLAQGDALQIEIPEVGRRRATVVWSSGQFYGCQFDDPLSRAAISSARLRGTHAVATSSPEILDDSCERDEDDDRASLTTRLRVILGASIVLWALIIWAVSTLIGTFD